MAETRDLDARYRLEAVLKETPAERTYRATESRSGGTVTVTVLALGALPEAETLRRRFSKRAAVLQGLEHANLPALLDFGLTPPGDPFLVQEWIEGESLVTLGASSPSQTLSYLLQAIDGLECLALHGLAHLNLVPDHLLVAQGQAGQAGAAGNDRQIRILGLGRSLLGGSGGSARDRQTSLFASPEVQTNKITSARWRADLYSLAAIATHLLGALVSQRPGGGPRVKIPPAMAGDLQDAAGLCRVLEGCLAWDPLERPASFTEVRIGFQHALRRSPREAKAGQDGKSPHETQPLTLDNPQLKALADPASPPAPPPLPREPVSPPPADPLGTLEGAETPVPAVFQEKTPATPQAARGEPTEARSPSGVTAGAAAAPPDAVGPRRPKDDDDGVLSLPALPAFPPLPPLPPASSPPPRQKPQAAAAAPPPPESGSGKPEKPSISALLPRATVSRVRRLLQGHRFQALPARLVLRSGMLGLGVVFLAGTLWWGSGKLLSNPDPGANVTPLPPMDDLPQASPAATESAEPEAPALHPQLERVFFYIAMGADEDARTALTAISPETEAELSPASCQAYESARQVLRMIRRDQLAADFRSALARGDFQGLGATLGSLSGDDEAALQEFVHGRRLLSLARRPVVLASRFDQAMDDGDLETALEHATSLIQALPAYVAAEAMRERAAQALEVEAEELARAENFTEARQRLDVLERRWPQRPGLAQRRAAMAAGKRSHDSLDALLTAAALAGEEKRPHEGIQLLTRMPAEAVPGRRAQQLRQTLRSLKEQLARLDRQAPVVELASRDDLTFRKGQNVTLRLRVTDDYQVVDVKVEARRASGPTVAQLSVRPLDGTSYAVEIDSSYHQDKTVELWVTATDRSGHSARLGSPEEPLELRRKRWFRN